MVKKSKSFLTLSSCAHTRLELPRTHAHFSKTSATLATLLFLSLGCVVGFMRAAVA
jgi:hypothetical protein